VWIGSVKVGSVRSWGSKQGALICWSADYPEAARQECRSTPMFRKGPSSIHWYLRGLHIAYADKPQRSGDIGMQMILGPGRLEVGESRSPSRASNRESWLLFERNSQIQDARFGDNIAQPNCSGSDHGYLPRPVLYTIA
jgi:hypothetical protein